MRTSPRTQHHRGVDDIGRVPDTAELPSRPGPLIVQRRNLDGRRAQQAWCSARRDSQVAVEVQLKPDPTNPGTTSIAGIR